MDISQQDSIAGSRYRKLEIVGAFKGSTIARRLVCLAGRVTVIRSQLDPATAGLVSFFEETPGASSETFLCLDTKRIHPSGLERIGFDGKISSALSQSVDEFMEAQGLPRALCGELLAKHFLNDARGRRLSDLSPPLRRAVELLGLISGRYQVAVLQDPFREMSDVMRETLSTSLVTAAAQHNLIIVVLNLNNRPHCWIENEYITRLQVERPERPTIGFGGNIGVNLGALRQQIISEFSSQNSEPEQNSWVDADQQTKSIPRWILPVFIFAGGLLCGLFLVMLDSRKVHSPPPTFSTSSPPEQKIIAE